MPPLPGNVDHATLKDFVGAVFAKSGLPGDDAVLVADALVWANLRGHDSHGVLRIPLYLSCLEKGYMNPRPNVHVAFENDAVCVIDADKAMGPVGMRAAMRRSIATARERTIGWTWLKNTTHSGAVGYFTRMALEEDMAGMILNGAQALMAAHGTATSALGTNPLSFAVPGGTGAPLVFDMATSAISRGAVTRARVSEEDLPAQTALDDKGVPTIDAAKVGTVLPLAGHKGSGLSFMIECFTSMMVNQPLINPIMAPGDYRLDTSQNVLLVAVNIGDFEEIGRFKANVGDFVNAIKAQPLQDGFEDILMPGERGTATYAQRLEDGIPLPRGTWDMLAEVAARLKLDGPSPQTM